MTKLNKILISRGANQMDLYRAIREHYPRNPIMIHQLSRIISGKVKHYSTFTVIRICKALDVTPNEIIEY